MALELKETLGSHLYQCYGYYFFILWYLARLSMGFGDGRTRFDF